MAQMDFESGHPFDSDDFDEFKGICSEDGYDVTTKDFDKPTWSN